MHTYIIMRHKSFPLENSKFPPASAEIQARSFSWATPVAVLKIRTARERSLAREGSPLQYCYSRLLLTARLARTRARLVANGSSHSQRQYKRYRECGIQPPLSLRPGLRAWLASSTREPRDSLRRVSSPPADDGTKHSSSRHASRRPRAPGLACLKVGSQQLTHRPTSRLSSRPPSPRFKSIGVASPKTTTRFQRPYELVRLWQRSPKIPLFREEANSLSSKLGWNYKLRGRKYQNVVNQFTRVAWKSDHAWIFQ